MTGAPLFGSLPGAVGSARGIAHFGELAREQRALERAAVIERFDRRVIRLGGSERLSWLDSISSQSLSGLRPGESTETLILDPHGHIEFVLHLVDDGEAAWLSVDAERAEAAQSWLERMRFRADVQIEALADWRVLSVLAPAGAEALERELAGLGQLIRWDDPWPGVSAGGFGYAETVAPWACIELLLDPASAERVLAAVSAGRLECAGLLAFDAARVAAGRPDASDLDERSLPHEFDWLRTAVHLNKGCYRGQETVAKVFNLGRPPRRLVLLHLDGSEAALPEPGDAVWADKHIGEEREPRQIGHVTASARHAELGPIALALIKRAVPDELAVRVRSGELEIAASIEPLVPREAGPAVEIPRLPRFGVRH